MGRKKIITDEQIIELIDRFYVEECNGDASLLKTKSIGIYIRNNGYPDCKDHLIRKKNTVKDYINKLKSAQDRNEVNILATYKTIDVDEFIENNHSKSSMKKALSELNMYYKSVSDAAIKLHKKNMELEEKLKKSLSDEENISKHKQEISDLKQIIKELKNENKQLRTIIDTYVYPEIANELLKENGLLQNTNGIVDTDVINSNMIHADTPIKSKSNVIQGLFERLED